MHAAIAIPSTLTLLLAGFFAGQAATKEPAEIRVSRLSLVDNQGHVRADLGMNAESRTGQPQFRLLDETGKERLVLELWDGGSGISILHSDGSTRAMLYSHNGESSLQFGLAGLAKQDPGTANERPFVTGGFVNITARGEGSNASGRVSVENAKGKRTYLNPEGLDAWPGK